MRAPSSVEIVEQGKAYTVTDSGLCCARCYASHGLVCTLAYRYAPTWGFTSRLRWVETYSCPFCRNEVNEAELRLPISGLPTLIEAGHRFYDRTSGDAFRGATAALVEFPPPPEPATESSPGDGDGQAAQQASLRQQAAAQALPARQIQDQGIRDSVASRVHHALQDPLADAKAATSSFAAMSAASARRGS